MRIFESPEFEEFARSLEAAMEDSARAPHIPCPACGEKMCHELGAGRLAGYRCAAFGCVGFQISCEELCDPDRYSVIVAECLERKKTREEMLVRNGAHTSTDRKAGDRWCGSCVAYHPPTTEHPECKLCKFAIHAPAPADIFFDYRGWHFTPPFICMGCGIEICFRQWAFSRSCGACDVSESRTRRLLYGNCFAGPHEKLPTWSAKEHDIPEDHFVSPEEREKYPILNPRKPSLRPRKRLERLLSRPPGT